MQVHPQPSLSFRRIAPPFTTKPGASKIFPNELGENLHQSPFSLVRRITSNLPSREAGRFTSNLPSHDTGKVISNLSSHEVGGITSNLSPRCGRGNIQSLLHEVGGVISKLPSRLREGIEGRAERPPFAFPCQNCSFSPSLILPRKAGEGFVVLSSHKAKLCGGGVWSFTSRGVERGLRVSSR